MKKISEIKREWLFSQVDILIKKGMSKADIARQLGILPQYLNSILSGTRGITDVFIDKFSEVYNINHNDLFSQGKHDLKPILKDSQEKKGKAFQSEKGIPLIPLEAVAGFGTNNSVQVMEYESEKYVVPDFRGAEFLIQVKGNSMYPKYASGDIVACKKLPLDTFFQWNKVYVIDSEQGVLIKRVKPAKDQEHVTLISENEKYDPFELHRKDINSLAIVIGVIRLE